MAIHLYTIEDARARAKKRLPRMLFDYIDGAAGKEQLAQENISAFEKIKLQPRTLVNVENRQLGKFFLGRHWNLPFGIAPMGLCDLEWPGADKMLASAAVEFNIPLTLSTMGSSTIETTRERAADNAWFQLYVGGSEQSAMELVDRAAHCGYDTLILTVDVPHVAPRVRDLRNGFKAPLKLGAKQIIDFALHPQWSVGSLVQGVPALVNVNEPQSSGNSSAGNNNSENQFKRESGRGSIDWHFLERLRKRWSKHLVIKGVLSSADALRMQQLGADAIYISNHGGRQLDSAPASINVLPDIRATLGDGFPLLIDSGIRDGESIVKALALGADFVMMGRPFSYAIGADGQRGLNNIIQLLADQISAVMAQLGVTEVEAIDQQVLYSAQQSAAE